MALTRSEQSLSRRGLLKTGLGALLLAPFLRERRLHAQNALPKRIVMVFTPDSNPPEWWPEGSGTNFTLSEPLSDFAGLEKHLLIPRRLDHTWTYDNHHVAGIVQLFTGARFDNNQNMFANGPSVDQYLLQNTDIRGGTPRASIHLAVDDGRTDHRHVICYSGSGQPVAAEANATRAFTNIFSGISFDGQPMPSEPTPTGPFTPNIEQAILNANSDDIRTLQRYLGQTEKQRLEQHLQSLAELRARITSPGTGGGEPLAACAKPDASGYSNNLKSEANVTRWAQINADMIVSAFACDVSRVASYQFSFSGGHLEGLLGFSKSWHDDIAHVSQTADSVSVGGQTMSSRAAFTRFSRFWYSHVAYLAKRLNEIPEGDGTMLDNTLIYTGVESGTNHSHSPVDMQYMLVGGRNLGLQTGQYLKTPSTMSAHRLHVAVLNAFGADVKTFGSADDGTGSLTGVLA